MSLVSPTIALEVCIRNLSKERGIRISENFIDYDNLRSGKITETQFFRVLKNNLGLQINKDQEKLLIEKYGVSGFINWKKFIKNIEQAIDPKNLSISPENQLRLKELADAKCMPMLGQEVLETFRPILSRINRFINYHGFIIRRCYQDFDVHNVGKVTESQFYRKFPGPQDISEAELCGLARFYSVPNQPGMVDYLRFENDLFSLHEEEKRAIEGIPSKPDLPDVHINTKEELQTPSISMIMDRITFAVYKFGIRVLDFFIDYDPLRLDEVTEHQFACALNLALSRAAQLSRFDIQQLINYFRSSKNSDKVSYREFCRSVDYPFNTMDLEKKPLNKAIMPPTGALSRCLPNLSEDDEIRVAEILGRLREKVNQRRIQTYTYFKDYDASTALTRTITCTQLGRILHFLNLDVSSEDCKLLGKKFADPTSGNVDYALFCEAIDSWFKASSVIKQTDKQLDDLPQPELGQVDREAARRDWEAISVPKVKSAGDSTPFDVLMARIRHLVLEHRIPLKNFFEDFDQLRSGSMNKDRFIRALSNAGLNRTDLHDLTPAQTDTIANNYVSESDPDMIRWLDFVNDVNTVFTLPELEKHPMVRVPPQERFIVPKPGTGDWACATDEMKTNYERGMQRLRRTVMERRIQCKPDFLAFDKLNRGYVTLQNFRQLLSMFAFHLEPEQIDAISAYYANDCGFNYSLFLKDLMPPSEEELVYQYPKRIEETRRINILGQKRLEREPVIRDAEGILDYIKYKIYHRRIRLSEWLRDHDPLNHGSITRQAFRRALGLLPITLQETEINIIEHYFKSGTNLINWRAFCEEIESIFAVPHLEKDPLKEANVYKSGNRVENNYLPIDLAVHADSAIHKIGNQVRQRRIQLTPLFSDFDETHRMTLSQSQFRRCLMTLGLADLITEREWISLYAKYRHPIGIIDNVNYLAFSDDVYEVAGMVYRTP